MRQDWRRREVGSSVLGDLSYTTAGSKFKHSGVFEVSKADTEEKQEKGTGSSLNVMVPSILEGIAYIQVNFQSIECQSNMLFILVTIQSDNEQLVSASLGQLNSPSSKPVELHWQQQLEAAHKVKELFSQLGPSVRSRLYLGISPDIQLFIILLCHCMPHVSTKQGGNTAPYDSNDHTDVLLVLLSPINNTF